MRPSTPGFLRFDPIIAANFKHLRPWLYDHWHLEKTFVRTNGEAYLVRRGRGRVIVESAKAE